MPTYTPEKIAELISTYHAVVRVIRSKHDSDENWLHEFFQIRFPETERERGLKPLKLESNRRIKQDPRTGVWSVREVFLRGRFQKTKFTKKMNLLKDPNIRAAHSKDQLEAIEKLIRNREFLRDVGSIDKIKITIN